MEVFNSGRTRAEHLLKLSELLLNTRRRGMRADWARRFKALMHWPQKEQIDRVDGPGAVLILREASGLKSKHFDEEYLNELLRAAYAGIVASLDRYCHEVVISRVVAQLSKSPKVASRELRQLRIPILAARKAILHARKPGTRPMNLVRQALQEVLHREETFQRPDDIARGMKIIGVDNLWGKCAQRLGCQPRDIAKRLNKIVDRRNRIVHEGDILRRKRGGKIAYHPIQATEVAGDIKWLSDLVNTIEDVVNEKPWNPGTK
ncbi:MAG: hypothetical protein K6U09_01030 [Acidobacteriia bacterium]|nr:hypothetical protein [Terriglobia bacterium]